MGAWQGGGVLLPHFSGAQYLMFPAVAMNQLRPGDLVFPADPNQHVALYVGGGMIVHATHTGDVIRQVPINQQGLGIVLAVPPPRSRAPPRPGDPAPGAPRPPQRSPPPPPP